MISVRAAVEPMNTALGRSQIIFLQGSFVGLPLINQALAAENPLGGGSFFVTVRSLIKVLGEIPPAAVLQAIAFANAPPPAPPPPVNQTPPVTSPPVATCQAELDLGQPGFGGITNMRIFGGGFLPGEAVSIIEQGQVTASAIADAFGNYSVRIGFLTGLFPTPHIVRALGESSGQTSNDAGFAV